MNLGRAIRIGAAAAVVVATAIEARRGHPNWEKQLYKGINNAPDELAPIAWLPMQEGSLTAPFVLAAVSYRRTKSLDPALAYAGAGFVTWLAAKGVKKLVGRGRPYDHDPTTNLRLATKIDGSLGYISGHAAVASTLATVMAHDQPLGRSLGVHALAVTVGITRIYAGAHLPLDTIGGNAFGILVGEATNALRESVCS
ncbi:MAG: phosphatase PAP2 family protein [Actinomycetota bacterium]